MTGMREEVLGCRGFEVRSTKFEDVEMLCLGVGDAMAMAGA